MEVKALAELPVRRVGEADPDAGLVAAARVDAGHFLPLYDRYFERVLGYVRLRVRDRATCEDVTSQVFLTALARIGTFRGRGSIRSLGTEQQHLLALRYGAGLGFTEIGAILGCSPGTARVRLHRILEDRRRRYPHDTP
jgi:DNA-directed RNA polymerase specialized sigma24 family protein